MNSLLDANVILRYLLNDIPEQADVASDAIKTGAFTIPEVIAEVIYVLDGVYQVKRAEVSGTLIELLDEISINEKPVIIKALELYRNNHLDYVDCVLIARSNLFGENVLSFDKKLNKALEKV